MLSYDDRPSMHTSVASRARPPRPVRQASSVRMQDTGAADRPAQHQHIWIITGPAGCGKTTVASYLADQLHLPYIEGDEYHPLANVRKMTQGVPLTDTDRWDWLVLLRKKAVERLTVTDRPGVVLTCSALKHKYRDVIRIAAYNDHDVTVHFIYLHADEQTLVQRVRARKGHYMKDSMVHSQFLTLEEPEDDEHDCLSVDACGSATQVQHEALDIVQALMAHDP